MFSVVPIFGIVVLIDYERQFSPVFYMVGFPRLTVDNLIGDVYGDQEFLSFEFLCGILFVFFVELLLEFSIVLWSVPDGDLPFVGFVYPRRIYPT
jgi:hypothetical protein